MGRRVFVSSCRVAGLTPPTATAMRRLAHIAPCLWWLASACGSDPTEGNLPPEPTTGSLELTISTSGHDLDPNGYTLAIDDGAPTVAPANGTVTHGEMQPGTHTLSFTGLDENCALQEQVPFSFSVTAGSPTKVTLHVTCAFANTLAFTQGGKLYITSADAGAVPRQIGENYYQVSWSPDGSTLGLSEPRTVSLADADGGNVRVLYRTETEYPTFQFADAVWSPDGTSLLVQYGSAHTHGLVSLSTSQQSYSLEGIPQYPPECHPVQEMIAPVPSWSPDSRHFVVNGRSDTADVYAVPMICMLSAEGKLEHALARGDYPDWSPDGSRIAFEAAQVSDSSIHTIAPDGTDERDLWPSSSGPRQRWPVWSPDGTELSFFVAIPGVDSPRYELWVMDALGGNRRKVAPEVTAYGRDAAWSRDGARLAFRLPSGQLAVVQRDGTGLTPASPVGDEVTSWDWRP